MATQPGPATYQHEDDDILPHNEVVYYFLSRCNKYALNRKGLCMLKFATPMEAKMESFLASMCVACSCSVKWFN